MNPGIGNVVKKDESSNKDGLAKIATSAKDVVADIIGTVYAVGHLIVLNLKKEYYEKIGIPYKFYVDDFAVVERTDKPKEKGY